MNTLVASIRDVRTDLEAAGARVHPGRFAPEALRVEALGDPASLSVLERGAACVQDEAAILVGHALDPQPGETVADVCAAPGTKTTHLAQLMGNRGRLVAADPRATRLARLTEAVARLGTTMVDARLADAARPRPGRRPGVRPRAGRRALLEPRRAPAQSRRQVAARGS